MNNTARPFSISVFAFVIIATSEARADKIDFSWQSSFSPSSIIADQPSMGSLGLVPLGGEAKASGGPSTDQYTVGATNRSILFEQTFSTFTNSPFTLTLKLTDGPSALSEALTFHGTVNGTAFIGGNLLAGEAPFASFSDGDRSLVIGHDTYHIQMLHGNLIGIAPDPAPDFIAKIDVTPASNTPEPSSLLLAGVGLPALGFMRRRNAGRL